MIPVESKLRVARPTDNLDAIGKMYADGLGFERLADFHGHGEFDGVILGHKNHPWHLEFTHHRGTTIGKAPTQDNLLVFYVPEKELWQAACERMDAAGFKRVTSYNAYWDDVGQTFEDLDGYRVVLQNREWPL